MAIFKENVKSTIAILQFRLIIAVLVNNVPILFSVVCSGIFNLPSTILDAFSGEVKFFNFFNSESLACFLQNGSEDKFTR